MRLNTAHLRGGLGAAMLAGTALLSACAPAPAPMTHTTTTTEQTTTTPPVLVPMAPPMTPMQTHQFEQE
jgi:hypothetical protein